MSRAKSNEAKASTRTACLARIETPLGYAGGVPESAHNDSESTAVTRLALRLVGSPQALSTVTTHIVARRARRAFIQVIRQIVERRGCFSIIPRNLRQFKRLPCLTSLFQIPSFATSSPHNAEHQRF